MQKWLQWFKTEYARQFMAATNNGKFAYIWEATYTDGSKVKQFSDALFQQLLDDDAPVPANLDEVRGTVDKLDVRKVKEFVLYPTGVACRYIPLIQPVRLIVDVENGEKFISYWLADYYQMTNSFMYRHVVGISKPVNGAAAKFFTVLSPIGQVTVATNDNQSYAGE